MNKIIYKKDNGVTMMAQRVVAVSPSPYLTEKDNCFREIINLENIKKLKKSQIYSVKRAIYDMLTLINNDKTSNYIEGFYQKIIKAKGQKDLIKITNEFQQSFFEVLEKQTPSIKHMYSYNYYIKDFNKYLQYYPDLVLSIFVKKIFATYFYECMNKILTKDIITELEDLKLMDSSIPELAHLAHVSFKNIPNNNGLKSLAERIFCDIIDIIYDSIQEHLCWYDCENCSPLLCPKIKDPCKKNIDEYDFITSGYQIFKDGELTSFIVTDCKKYKKESSRVNNYTSFN